VGEGEGSPSVLGLMKKRIVMWLTSSLAAITLFVGCWVAVVVNPFEWGAETSSKFTWEKFGKVQRGETMVRVVDLLGEPIQPAMSYESITGDDRTRVCKEAGRCRQYQFAGVRLIGGREAIIIADARTGTVLDKRINYEP
jgi:hypothetical protein